MKTKIDKTTADDQESDAKRAKRIENVQKQLGPYNNDTNETKLKDRR